MSEDFPTMQEVKTADLEQLARWYRFLVAGGDQERQLVLDYVARRLDALGGMTPELSMKVGFGGVK